MSLKFKTPESSNFINSQVVTFEEFQVNCIKLPSQQTPRHLSQYNYMLDECFQVTSQDCQVTK